MSDQISEKLARFYYSAGTSGGWAEQEDEFIENLKRKNLIRSSKLDEAREFCDNARGTIVHGGGYGDGYRTGVLAAEARFEAAIAEILEERE